FHLDRPEHWLPNVGATFHGRDVFAPVAARLAGGQPVEELGSRIADPTRLDIPHPTVHDGGVSGQVLLVDGFGNAVTNLRPEDLADCSSWSFHVAGREVEGPSTHYGAVPMGAPLVLLGSLGYYEVAVNGGSAASELGIQPGAGIRTRPR
ncbi:MAG TPA: SAM-dependent chlorinase/fluorinase, partial [Armatimonadota bacterium]|nr:SAM-dependent chlorinase/fluorinase [Armatimonadota bacterium]